MKKTLSIVLSIVMLLSLFSGVDFFALADSDIKTVTGIFNYANANNVLSLVNGERTKNGIAPLVMTRSLSDSAMLRSAEIVVSFSHVRPNGEDCFTAIDWEGAVGENIAMGQSSPDMVMDSWMNSKGHRANILNPNFSSIGIGCFECGGTYYWVQVFSGGDGESFYDSGTLNAKVDVSLNKNVKTSVHYCVDNNHTVVYQKAVAPTFTRNGKTDGSYCSVCGKVFKLQKTVKKLSSPKIKKVSKGKKSFTATWNKISGVDGYQIQYSLNKNMKKSKKKTVAASKSKLKVGKLKKGKKYYVSIRAYKVINGKKIYSNWSKTKTVKTK